MRSTECSTEVGGGGGGGGGGHCCLFLSHTLLLSCKCVLMVVTCIQLDKIHAQISFRLLFVVVVHYTLAI